jgi:sulfofructose kinase
LPQELDQDYLTQGEFLLLDGIHPEAALQAAGWMQAAGKRVMLDANVTHGPPSDQIRSLIHRTDLLICSRGFCQALTGSADLAAAARKTLEMGPRMVVQTDGRHGSDTFTPEDAFHTPAYAVEALDTSGAGDVFHGAFVFGLLQGWDLRRTAAFSSAAAAIKCTKMGREGHPTLAETLQWMEKAGY